MEDKFSNEEKSIETPQPIIDATILKLRNFLNRDYPEHIDFGNGTYTISRGSTQVMIIVRHYTDSECIVEFISNVVTGAEITNELMAFLLRKNAEMHFGSFGLLFDNTITFSHSISGSVLNSDELKNSLNTVAFIADYYDDFIVEMAGGKRATDLEQDFELVEA